MLRQLFSCMSEQNVLVEKDLRTLTQFDNFMAYSTDFDLKIYRVSTI